MPNTAYSKYFKFIEWSLFFGLCALSGVFMGGVLDKFISGKTGFTQSEEPIMESPTLDLCFSLPETRNTTFMYETDFKIKYSIIEQSLDTVQSILLKEGENVTISNEIIYLEKLVTAYFGTCYKITPMVFDVTIQIKQIFIYFNESFLEEDLPSVNLFITSEINAYGVVLNDWKNGKVTRSQIDGKGMFKVISLKVEQWNYLTTNSNHNKESYYECISRHIRQNIECSPLTLPNLPICNSTQTDELNKFWKFYRNQWLRLVHCHKKLSHTLGYFGEETYHQKFKTPRGFLNNSLFRHHLGCNKFHLNVLG